MTLNVDDIPSIDVAPAASRRSAVAAALRRQSPSRRSVLRAAVGTGMTIGLTAVGWLPGARPAHAGWHSRYSQWPDCHGYHDPESTCTPPSWYISADNCNGENFHRDDMDNGGCNYTNWNVKLTCGGRNAWKWGDTRCSDGHYYHVDCSGRETNTNSICRGPVI